MIQNIALFLTSFLSAHLRLVEQPDNEAVLLNAYGALPELSLTAARHLYLVKISQVEEREVFKMCVERAETETDDAAASSTGRGW